MEDGMRLENSPSPTIDNISVARLGTPTEARHTGEESVKMRSTHSGDDFERETNLPGDMFANTTGARQSLPQRDDGSVFVPGGCDIPA
ncbi:MAG: hypothetical protein A4E58_01605 [Syntrophorhabdus sp. PtaB.Bin006]|nr:MAG: hypothetical protein A4E58_01605 [Syntrophorhabdus sp. PtaB.Bin006]